MWNWGSRELVKLYLLINSDDFTRSIQSDRFSYPHWASCLISMRLSFSVRRSKLNRNLISSLMLNHLQWESEIWIKSTMQSKNSLDRMKLKTFFITLSLFAKIKNVVCIYAKKNYFLNSISISLDSMKSQRFFFFPSTFCSAQNRLRLGNIFFIHRVNIYIYISHWAATIARYERSTVR